MDFIVHTSDDVLPVSGSFKVQDNGTLVVNDPGRDKRTTFSPSGWTKVEQKLPDPPPAPPLPRAVR